MAEFYTHPLILNEAQNLRIVIHLIHRIVCLAQFLCRINFPDIPKDFSVFISAIRVYENTSVLTIAILVERIEYRKVIIRIKIRNSVYEYRYHSSVLFFSGIEVCLEAVSNRIKNYSAAVNPLAEKSVVGIYRDIGVTLISNYIPFSVLMAITGKVTKAVVNAPEACLFSIFLNNTASAVYCFIIRDIFIQVVVKISAVHSVSVEAIKFLVEFAIGMRLLVHRRCGAIAAFTVLADEFLMMIQERTLARELTVFVKPKLIEASEII